MRASLSAAVLGSVLISGCAVYKPEIAQGNFVSREQAQALQPGMTQAQVSQILGTPLLTDLFRPDRWDYVFTLIHRGGVEPQRHAVSVFFKNGVLERVEGADTLPTETEFVSAVDRTKKYPERKLSADPAKMQAFAEQERARAPKPTVQVDNPTAPATSEFPSLPQ